MRIRWSDIAEDDLDAIYDYIAQDQPGNAERFTDRLVDSVIPLQDNPYLGRPVPEAEDRADVRELIHQGYRILYLVQAEHQQVQILTLLHGSRNLAGLPVKPWESTPDNEPL